MRALICVLPGDGIGPEVTTEAVSVLEAVAQANGTQVHLGRYPTKEAACAAYSAFAKEQWGEFAP